MWSQKQKALVKQAQRELGLADEDYRLDLATLMGVDSSTAPRLGDRDFDRLLAYWEALLERAEAGNVNHLTLNIRPLPARKIFRAPRYWRDKNNRHNTSRDRHRQRRLTADIRDLEAQLLHLGKDRAYLAAIDRNCHADPIAYRAALQRTLKAMSQERRAMSQEQ